MCVAGGVVCHGMSAPPAKVDRIKNKVMQWQPRAVESPPSAFVPVRIKGQLKDKFKCFA